MASMPPSGSGQMAEWHQVCSKSVMQATDVDVRRLPRAVEGLGLEFQLGVQVSCLFLLQT